jgi:nuclear transport factor 2 (NTF2) superfamily protein
MSSPIRPPFTLETALAKVQATEDAWNSRDPQLMARRCASINDAPIREDERRLFGSRTDGGVG